LIGWPGSGDPGELADSAIAAGASKVFDLAPGTYTVTVVKAGKKLVQNIEIPAGGEALLLLIKDDKLVVDNPSGPALDKTHGILRVLNQSAENINSIETKTAGAGTYAALTDSAIAVGASSKSFSLKPGTYDVRINRGASGPLESLGVVITAGEETYLILTDTILVVDTVPPAEVDNLVVTAKNGAVDFTWTDPADGDFAYVEITYTPAAAGTAAVTFAKGLQAGSVSGLDNGTAYAFSVKTADKSGNHSEGLLKTATPKAPVNLLDLTAEVPFPLVGNNPDKAPYNRNIITAQYYGPVAWYTDAAGTVPATGTFELGRTYTAKITLEAYPAYTFTGVAPNSFSHSTASARNAVNSGTVYLSFNTSVIDFYVDQAGDNTKSGRSPAEAVLNMDVILVRVKAAYDAVTPPWPGKSAGTPVRAAINIKGITGDTHTVTIDGGLLPPILLRNYDGPGVIGKSGWVDSLLYLKNNADVTMDGDLTLKNGNAGDSTYVSAAYGGGVYIEGPSLFTLKSGIITENNATNGGGVAVEGSGSRFLMEGGTISANVTSSTTGKGGGVRLYNQAYFEMTGGTITGHTVAHSGGGVLAKNNSTFILDGGNIVGNTAQGGLTSWHLLNPSRAAAECI